MVGQRAPRTTTACHTPRVLDEFAVETLPRTLRTLRDSAWLHNHVPGGVEPQVKGTHPESGVLILQFIYLSTLMAGTGTLSPLSRHAISSILGKGYAAYYRPSAVKMSHLPLI